MNSIALIPARSGSKRVKDKNIREVGGYPLLVWSILLCRHMNIKCFVSTDSIGYGKIAREQGVEVIMRDPEICTDDTGDREVIVDALNVLRDKPDLIIYLRPTTPFRTASLVDMAIQQMIEAGENASGLRSIELMSESVFKNFMLERGYLKPILYGDQDLTDTPNQKCPQTYKPNGYIDIAKRSTIEAGKLWGQKVIGFLTPHTIEIDTETDLAYADWFAKSRNMREEVIFR